MGRREAGEVGLSQSLAGGKGRRGEIGEETRERR